MKLRVQNVPRSIDAQEQAGGGSRIHSCDHLSLCELAATTNCDMPLETKPWKSIYRPNLFLGKVALVTGGGSGIGRAIAIEIASLGATTVIASRDEDKCKAAAQEMNSLLERGCKGKIVVGPSCSIRSEDEVEQLISWIIETYGAIHMLVNNAGGQFVCSAEDLSGKGFAAVVDTNLTGTFLCCRIVYSSYMRDHGGTIVKYVPPTTHKKSLILKSDNILRMFSDKFLLSFFCPRSITLGNRNGLVGMAHSGAARAGIENMTATLCSEWIESDVRINCVRPGVIFTDSGFANYGAIGDEFLRKVIPSQPAKRLGSPEEVSSAVCWLLSEGASYVTGAIVCVDGGSAYHFLPLLDIPNSPHLPIYGTLPRKAML